MTRVLILTREYPPTVEGGLGFDWADVARQTGAVYDSVISAAAPTEA